MGLIVKRENATSIPPLEEGVYVATCCAIIDLGTQYSERFDKLSPKVQIMFNINGETIKYKKDNEEIELPRVLSKEYTMTLSEKGNLIKDLEAWRGKKFTDEELKGFDLNNVLNTGCQVSIINEEKNGRVYSDIQSIMALMKGASANKLLDAFIFNMNDEETYKYWDKIPTWIQDKIKKATNYAETTLSSIAGAEEEKVETKEDEKFVAVDNSEELPF